MIKNLTYHNVLRVAKMIERKGYSAEEALTLARCKFAEFNPNGMPIESMVKMMLTKEEFIKEYGNEYGA